MKTTWMLAWLAGVTLCSGQLYFEAGPWVRGDMDLTVEGGSSAAQENVLAAIPGTSGGRAWIAPLDPGDDGTAQILRQFDNGYVGPSGWPGALGLGHSQYFGYESAGQYDSAASSLSFSLSESASSSAQRTSTHVSSGASGWNGKADLDGVGGQVTLGYTFLTDHLFNVSIQIQGGWLDGMDTSFSGQQTWSQQVTWDRHESIMERSQSWNYIYDTLGNPSFPTAPYEMTDPSGIGPMIADRPTSIDEGDSSFISTDRLVDSKQRMAFSRVDLDADMNAMVLTLGPRLHFYPTERLAILLQGGLTSTLLDASLSRTETFAWEDGQIIQSWTDHENKQEWLWGGTISAGLELNLNSNLYVLASGGYDWVERQEFVIGPDRVEVDLSGWRADVGLGWRLGSGK